MRIISSDIKKKQNSKYQVELSEKEMVVLSGLVGNSVNGGEIINDLYETLKVFYPENMLIGSVNLSKVAKYLKEVYED